LASATPILAANPNPQINFVGTAGIERVSDWWWSIRMRALQGEPGDFSYLEHSAERVELNRDGHVVSEPPNVKDLEAWRRANPALDERIEEAFLAEQLRNLGADLFAREHLCVWDPYPNAEGGFLPVEEWAKLVIPLEDVRLSSVSYGLSVSEHSAAFASAGRLPNGDLYVDTVEAERGTEWVEAYAVDLHDRKKKPIRVNPSAPEGGFVRPLREAGVAVEEVSARQYQQACAEVLDAIKNGTIRHLDQSELNRSVRVVQRRDVGKEGAWVWADSPTDLTTLKAATLALTGVTNQRPPRIYTLTEVPG
jgi:hypothetical protein